MIEKNKIAIGADHAGVKTKDMVIGHLRSKGYSVIDYGTSTPESCDYPDFAFRVGETVRDHVADFGVLLCTTGIGMSIAANKVKGVRAALLTDLPSAKSARAHNHANVACFSTINSEQKLLQMLDIFLNTGEEASRHERRVLKIDDYDNNRG